MNEKQVYENQETAIKLLEENVELKKRVQKALEYINNYLPNYDFDKTNLKKLLFILKGSDKNE